MTRRVVLVLSEDGDWSADAVTAELDDRRVAWFRFDTAEFPQRMALTATLDGSHTWTGRISTARGEVMLDEVQAVFYRRPGTFEFAAEMSEPETTVRTRSGKGRPWRNPDEPAGELGVAPVRARGRGVQAEAARRGAAVRVDAAADIGHQ